MCISIHNALGMVDFDSQRQPAGDNPSRGVMCNFNTEEEGKIQTHN